MWTEQRLAGLDVRNGFRMRGREITRLEALTDSAFALALTFLVIAQQQVPQSFDELLLAFRQVPTFAACFTILLLFWNSHVRWSRRYGLEDTASVVLSCLMIFTVLVFVYPLKMCLGAFFSYLSGGWLPGAVAFHSLEQLREAFIAYGIGFTMLEISMFGLYRHALNQAAALDLDALERFDTHAERNGRLCGLAISVFASLLAVLLTPQWAPLSGYAYALFWIVEPIYWRRVRRMRGLLTAVRASS